MELYSNGKAKRAGKKIRSLPAPLRKEALRYIDYLLAQCHQDTRPKKEFTFNWENKLSELKEKFGSVELQHEANKWRQAF